MGIVPRECDGLVVSPEFQVFQVQQERVLPEVLHMYFSTPSVLLPPSGQDCLVQVQARTCDAGRTGSPAARGSERAGLASG
jgi:hypothetical protein